MSSSVSMENGGSAAKRYLLQAMSASIMSRVTGMLVQVRQDRASLRMGFHPFVSTSFLSVSCRVRTISNSARSVGSADSAAAAAAAVFRFRSSILLVTLAVPVEGPCNRQRHEDIRTGLGPEGMLPWQFRGVSFDDGLLSSSLPSCGWGYLRVVEWGMRIYMQFVEWEENEKEKKM